MLRRLLLAAVAIGIVLTWRASGDTIGAGSGSAAWDLELASTGPRPTMALVVGREAGVHFVRIPAADAPAAQRRRIPVRLAAGKVYLASLGWASLDVRTAAPSGEMPMALGAKGRFVQLYKDARGAGIRTSW